MAETQKSPPKTVGISYLEIIGDNLQQTCNQFAIKFAINFVYLSSIFFYFVLLQNKEKVEKSTEIYSKQANSRYFLWWR